MKRKTVISMLAVCALLLSGFAQAGGVAATDIDSQARLFGGYVASDSAIQLYSEPDENSDVIREIERGTQIDIYECDAEGSSYVNGTIGIVYEEYADGSRVPLFVFYDDSGESFMACYATVPGERTDGCLYIGQDGESRLVPADP